MRSALFRRRRVVLVVAALAVAGIFGALAGVLQMPTPTATGGHANKRSDPVHALTATRPVAEDHAPVMTDPWHANAMDATATKAESEAAVDRLCLMAARQQAEDRDGNDIRTGQDEPTESRRRLAATCATRPMPSDDDVDALLRSAAAAGNPGAKRALLEAKLQQDEQDTDAVAAGLSVSDRAAIRAYYADDVQALRELALHGDLQAAGQMAHLAEDGRLVEQDIVAAAAWRLYASASAAGSLPGDDILSTDPALDDFGDRDRAMAVAAAKDLYARRR